MPFFEHLTALRTVLMRVAIALVMGFLVAYPFAEKIFEWLRRPLAVATNGQPPQLIYTGPFEVFTAFMKLALAAGLLLTLPYLAFEFWRFLAPALQRRERRLIVTATASL